MVYQQMTNKENQTVVAKKTAAAARTAKPAAVAEEIGAADLLSDLATFLNEWAERNGVPPFAADSAPVTAKRKAAAAKATAKAEPEADEDDETGDDNTERRAELNAMSIAALKRLAIKAGFEAEEVASARKADLVDSILDDESSTDDDAADEDEAEDDEEGEGDEEETEEGYARADLEGKGLRELQAIAREEYGLTRKDYAGMDIDTLITHLTGDSGEDEADEDEDDEEEGYTEEDLNELSLADLKGVAKEYGVKVRVGMAKAAIAKAILAAQE